MLKNAVLYGRIILLALPFNTLQLLFQSFCVTAEKPKLGLGVTVLSGITNMVLDAVLVISLPQEYKLAGAAVATALSQVVGGGVPLLYFAKKKQQYPPAGQVPLRRQDPAAGVRERLVGIHEQHLHEPCGHAV